MKILLAVDGSKHSLKAVKTLIDHADWYREKPAVELVNVRLPVPSIRGMGAVVGAGQVRRYYDREGKAALSRTRKLLDAKGIKYSAHILVGPVAGPARAYPEGRQSCEITPTRNSRAG